MKITYEDGETIESTDNQQVFNRVVTKLMEQGAQSQDITGTCLYRCGPEESGGPTLKCAAGHLILDKDYYEYFEEQGMFVPDDYPQLSIAGKYFKSREFDIQFITEVQSIHDNYECRNWPTKFSALAGRYDLDASVLNKYTV